MRARRRLVLAMAAVAVVALAADAQAASSPFGVATPDSPTGAGFGGPLGPVFQWIALRQAEFYRSLTGMLSRIREDGTAAWLLVGLSFAYGVFHAAGPGHGKAVISSYLVASGDSVRRGVAISFIAAFVQALSAVLFVAVAALVFRATAMTMTAATEWMEIFSYALIALVGAWLVWSKSFGGGHHHHHHHHHHVPAAAGAPGAHGHAHDDHAHHDHAHHDHGAGHGHHDHAHHDHAHAGHVHGGHAHAGHDHADHHHDAAIACAACDVHGHAPAIAAGAGAGGTLARAWTAILAVGIRPCSGAIIILVFALSQGLFAVGVLSTFVMALGTGLTVAILAALAVSAKGLALRLAGADSPAAATVLRVFEIGGGVVVLLFGLLLLGGALAGGLPGG